MKTVVLVFLYILYGCKMGNTDVLPYKENGANNQYCFDEIKDTLTKINDYKNMLKKCNYNLISRTHMFELLSSPNETYQERINKFYEESDSVEAFTMNNNGSLALILIGKALGATGIGVDYWNYQYYSLDKSDLAFEFSSLIRTPYSVYLDTNGEISHIEIEDDFPRPASGEAVQLDYMPLLIHIVTNYKVESTLEFPCKYPFLN